jgi:multidrug resistance efflux pump
MPTRSGTTLAKTLPVIIWLGAVLAVVSLYTQRVHSFMATGLAVSRAQTISAVGDGIIRHIAVKACQSVNKGDVLAVLELGNPVENEYTQTLAEAQKTTARAEMEHLKSELSAMQEELTAEIAQRRTDESLRYQQLVLDVNRARVTLLENKTALESDRGLLAGLQQEKAILEDLLSKQAVDLYEVQKIRIEHDGLAGKVTAEEELLAQARIDLDQAQNRLSQYKLPATESTEELRRRLEPFDKAIAVQEKYIEELLAPSHTLIVRAEFDGVVGSISCTEGQSVTTEMSIMTLTSPVAEYVTVWLDQRQSGIVHEKMPLEIIKMTAPHSVFKAEVASMGSAFEQLPEQLWKTPGTPQWGRPVRISVSPESGLLGNEVVGVYGL